MSPSWFAAKRIYLFQLCRSLGAIVFLFQPGQPEVDFPLIGWANEEDFAMWTGEAALRASSSQIRRQRAGHGGSRSPDPGVFVFFRFSTWGESLMVKPISFIQFPNRHDKASQNHKSSLSVALFCKVWYFPSENNSLAGLALFRRKMC